MTAPKPFPIAPLGENSPADVAVCRLEDMVGGWFVGAFSPTALHCAEAEVAVKIYTAGDAEASHVHKVGTEVTLILTGKARMCERDLAAGDIIVVQPGAHTGFVAVTDVTTVVVKTPSIANDKFMTVEVP